VTEKDMPPEKIVKLGRQAGFSRFQVYPMPSELTRTFHARPDLGEGTISKESETIGDPSDSDFWTRPENIPCLRDTATSAATGGVLRRGVRNAKWFLARIGLGRQCERVILSWPFRHLASVAANLRDSGLVLMVK
jgi:hypothetical protein